jgi:hypothetical protein
MDADAVARLIVVLFPSTVASERVANNGNQRIDAGVLNRHLEQAAFWTAPELVANPGIDDADHLTIEGIGEGT